METKISTVSCARYQSVSFLMCLMRKTGKKARPTMQDLLNEANFTDKRDAALCAELIFGTLRHYILIKWILAHFLPRMEKIPLPAFSILLSASYELLFLDRIPPRATIYEAVEICKIYSPGLCGLVNAVLRKVQKFKKIIYEPDWIEKEIKEALEQISIKYSTPLWIVSLWNKSYGRNATESLAKHSLIRPLSAIRLNSMCDNWLLQKEQLVTKGAIATGFSGLLFTPGTLTEETDHLEREGRASWQGAGAQEILHYLNMSTWDNPIWDACAGRGNKTCAMLEAGLNVCLASDPNPRVHNIAQECLRLGLTRPQIIRARAQEIRPDFIPGSIVLDVPCSGLGTLARKPDICLNMTEKNIEDLVNLQSSLLCHAWSVLPAGGCLVYLTCTINPDENEGQVRKMLSNYPDAKLEKECCTRGEYGADIMYGALLYKS